MDKVYSVEELKEILYKEFFIITDTPQDGICYLREDGMFLYFDEDLVVDYFDHLPTHGIEIDWLLEERYISSDFDLFFGVIPDLNDGYYREEESRISLSTIDKLTAQQYSSLKLWIEKVIYLDNRVDGLTVVTNKPFGGRQSYVRYPLYEPGTSIVRDDISANYIINRIKRYFSTGQLLENKHTVTDNLGRPLSKEQQKYFKNSKVRDINGNLLTVYHGTKSEDFDVFDNTIHSKEVGSHFGTKEAAAEFGPSREYYLNITNPLYSDVDMEEGWDVASVLELIIFNGLIPNLTQNESDRLRYIWNSCFIGDYHPTTLDDIIRDLNLSEYYLELEQLIDYGPELVKAIGGTPDWSRVYDKQDYIMNVITSRGHDGIKYINTVEDKNSISWIVFKPNQIKLVTNKTPTNKDSIKENKDNVEVDDLNRPLSKEQQNYFKDSKVRDINGNLLTVYHGTKYDFEVFNTWGDISYELGSHFGTKKAAQARESSKVKELYLNITNPLEAPTDVSTWDVYGLLELILRFGMLNEGLTEEEYNTLADLWNSCAEYENEEDLTYEDFDSNLIDSMSCSGWVVTSIDEYMYILEEIITSRGYDGIYYINDIEDPGSISWIIFNPEQAKLVTNKTPTNSDSIKENINKGETNMKVKEFNEVGEVIAKHLPNVDKIELDAFTSGGYNYEYLVVTFRGGSISVRNAAANSLIANLQELALLLNGGYYREVETYKKLKEADTLSESKEWVEDKEEQLTYQHLLDFATRLSRSQGSYGRIAAGLREMDEFEIEEMNESLIELGYKNDLMTIIDIFEG